MMQLKFTVEIQTGLTRKQRNGGWNAECKPLLLRVSGTPQQLANFLGDLKGLPVNLGIRASFEKDRPHHTGVIIHSKVSIPVDQAFASSLDSTLAQVVALC